MANKYFKSNIWQKSILKSTWQKYILKVTWQQNQNKLYLAKYPPPPLPFTVYKWPADGRVTHPDDNEASCGTSPGLQPRSVTWTGSGCGGINNNTQ